jgi:hypothetical protein
MKNQGWKYYIMSGDTRIWWYMMDIATGLSKVEWKQ